MQVTKEQIVDGIFRYGDNEIMPRIDVKMVRQMVGATLLAIKLEPSIMDKILESPMISAALKENGGFYDLEFAEKILCETVRTYGPIEFTPPIPKFLMGGAENKSFRFDETDIRKLRSMIEKGAS